jgi:hypothetical protein
MFSIPHVPREIQTQQEQRTLSIVFTLLVILCLFCLGSFPMVSHAVVTTPSHSQQQIVISSGGDPCTAKTGDIHYLRTTQQQLPTQWMQAGFNTQDFTHAQLCAASFVIAYQSFNFNQVKTFETSSSLLTAQGRKRFYGQVPGSTADERTNLLWRAGMQKQHISQSAQAAQPNILATQFVNKHVLTWMHVQYSVTVSRNSDVFTLPADDMTVLLVSLPPDSLNIDTVWQISAWQAGSRTFPLPPII